MNFIETRRNNKKIMQLFGFEYNLDDNDVLYECDTPNNKNRLKAIIEDIAKLDDCEHGIPLDLCTICPNELTHPNCPHGLPILICMKCTHG